MNAATFASAMEWTSVLAAAAQRGGEKLPPPTRAAALMALVGIALLGMLLVVIILLGGHWVRRVGSYRRGSSVPRDRRPLRRDSLEPISDAELAPTPDAPPAPAGEFSSGDTSAPGETVAT